MKHISPEPPLHTVRHPFAPHSVKKGARIRKALGHASFTTTSISVDLARAVMDEEMQKNAL